MSIVETNIELRRMNVLYMVARKPAIPVIPASREAIFSVRVPPLLHDFSCYINNRLSKQVRISTRSVG